MKLDYYMPKTGDDLQPHTSLLPKLFIMSDRAAADLALPYFLYYEVKMRGFFRSDPLHDDWNVSFNGVRAAGCSSQRLSWFFFFADDPWLSSHRRQDLSNIDKENP